MLDGEVDTLSFKLVFDFEPYVTEKNETLDLDEKEDASSDICRFFLKGNCTKGHDCPYKHTKTEHAVVCKHWLRGLCKKGELCEFLHEYDLQKMPECYFFSKYGECNNKECMYLHLNPEEKVIECPWYARGFCKHGPKCRHKHVKKLLCENFYLGFCPEGPKCKYGHPKWEVPKEDLESKQDIEKQQQSQLQSQQYNQHILTQLSTVKNANNPNGGEQDGQQKGTGKVPICHFCGVVGHKSTTCPQKEQGGEGAAAGGAGGQKQQGPPLESVLCFKCNQTGHYANKCTNKRSDQQRQHQPGYQGQQNQQGGGYQGQQNQQGGGYQGGGGGYQGQQNQQYQQQQQNQYYQQGPPPQGYQQQQGQYNNY